MAQTLSFSSVVATGSGWSNGSNVQTSNNGYAVCDTGGTGTSGILKIALTNPTDPLDHTSHIITVECQKSSGTTPDAGTAHLTAELRESGTLRGTLGPTQPNSGSDTNLTYTLSTAEAAAISNYNNLELWLTVEVVAGSSGHRTVSVDYVKVTIPDLAVPAQVTGVSASDGTYTDKVRVSYNTAARADDYNVYRNTSNSWTGATKIVDGDAASPYDDTTAVAGTTYYYGVRGSNASGEGPNSSLNSGYVLALPAAPTGVAASDGTFTSKVEIVWNAVATADTYKVYRNTVDSIPGSELAIGITTTSYDDTTAANNTVYYYWVKAVNAVGEGPASSSDSGYRLEAPAAPTAVAATDGTYADKVEVSWTASAGASTYSIYRNTLDSLPGSALVTGLTASPYDDTTAVSGTTYWYWVKAHNTGGDSPASTSDSGYALGGDITITPAAAILTLSASIGSVTVPQPNRTWRDVFVAYNPSSEMLHVGQIEMTHALDPGTGDSSEVEFHHFTYELPGRALHHFSYEDTFPSCFASVQTFTTSERGGAYLDRPDSVIVGFWSWGSHPDLDRYPPALLYEASIPAEESTVPSTAGYPSYAASTPAENCYFILPAADNGSPGVHKSLRRITVYVIPPPDESETGTVEVTVIPHAVNAQANATDPIVETKTFTGYNAAGGVPMQPTKAVYVDFDPEDASGESFEIKVKLTNGVGIRRVSVELDVGGETDTMDYQP